MLYQGVDLPLLMLDTIIEHGDGWVAVEAKSEDLEENRRDKEWLARCGSCATHPSG